MKRLVPALLLLLATVLPGTGATTAAAASQETPEQFVQRTSNDVLAVLNDRSLAHDAKIERLQAMLDARSDFDSIAKLVLAQHYRTFSDAQKKDFEVLLHRYLTNTYGKQIDDYGSETVTVRGGRPEARGDYTVQTLLHRPTGADLSVDYRLRKVGDEWRLLDVIGEGVSLVSNLRSQFGEVLSQGGPERLLKLLREKNASGSAAELPKAGKG